MCWDTVKIKMMNGFFLALSFLTTIKTPLNPEFNTKNLKSSMAFYPIVGTILIAVPTLLFWLISPHSSILAAALAVIGLIFFTGGLHLDGLGDTFDGFLANKDIDKTKDIMKDSRIGSFGVIAVFSVILLKIAALASLEASDFKVLLVIAGFSRICALYLINFKKPAAETGYGKLLSDLNAKKESLIGSAVFLVFAVLILKFSAVLILISGLILTELISRWSYKKINGVTGDVYGAAIELTEVIMLILYWVIKLWK